MKQYLITEFQIAKLISDAWNAGEAWGSGFPSDSFHNFNDGVVEPFLKKLPQSE